MPESRRASIAQRHAPASPPDPLAGWPAPMWRRPGAALYAGEAGACLCAMPARSVQCCVTSPPYWGLRSYLADDHDHKAAEIGAEPSPDCGSLGQAQCGRCYVCALVGVFRAVHRVLRDDGVLWLNLGDCYSSGGIGGGPSGPGLDGTSNRVRQPGRRPVQSGLPPGNLVGAPWRVALALQADGWVLRSDMPWVKRSPMPDSALTRPGRSLEYVFLFSKSQGYYFDMDAVRPRASTLAGAGGACFGRVLDPAGAAAAGNQSRRYDRPDYIDRAWRNNDIWFESAGKPHGLVGAGDELLGLDVTPTTKGYKGQHFAVFPARLVEPLILSSTSAHGCCASCGRSYERVNQETVVSRRKAEGGVYAQQPGRTGTDHQNVGRHSLRAGVRTILRETVGWRKMCGCRGEQVAPCVVLDPFVGSGTTVAVALAHGRAGVGIDLSGEYLRDIAVPRIEEAAGDATRRVVSPALPAAVPPRPARIS